MSLKSSPVPLDSDPDADIDAYINWHIRKTPMHIDLLNAAKAKLLAEGMTLKTVRKLNKQDYNDMNIPKGIEMRLTNEVKIYKKSRE